MKILCSFASARRSNVIFYEVWPVFKQPSPLSNRTRHDKWEYKTSQERCAPCSCFLLFFYHQSISQSAPTPNLPFNKPYNRSCQQVLVRECDCASSWTRPEEVKLLRLMPAVAIVCFSFPTGRIIPVRLEKRLCRERREKLFLFSRSPLLFFFASNFDAPIIVDLLLLGWLHRRILSVSRRD